MQSLIKQIASYKTLLSTAVLLALGAGFLYGGMFWILNEKQATIGELLGTIERETKRSNEIKGLASVVESTKLERAELDTYFLKEDEVVPFIETIERLGDDVGIVVTFSEVNIYEADTPFLKMRIEAKGKLLNMYHFISLLEQARGSLLFEQAFLEEVEADMWQADIGALVLSFQKSAP